MTLINTWTGKDGAIVVSDSLATRGGRPAAFQAKCYCIPHAAMLLTGRGPDDVAWRALWDLAHTPFADGIDGAERILPGLLEDAHGETVQRYGGHDLPCIIAAVGYSPRASAYRSTHFQSCNGFEPEPQPAGIYLSPAPRGYQPGRLQAPTDDMWVGAAIEQQRVLAEEKAPAWCSVGGDLFAYELTRAGLSIRKLARLPWHAEAVAEMTRGERKPTPSPISRLLDA